MNQQILEYLRNQGISVAAVAKYMNISRASLNNKLKGRQKLTAGQIALLKQYLANVADDTQELINKIK